MDDLPTPAPRNVRLALVGLGKIARDQHLPSIAAVGGYELVATVSPSGARLDGVPAFTDTGQLAADGPPVDAVAICTPPQVRAGLVAEAVAAGWACLLEKPPAATVEEAEGMRALAAAHGVPLYATWHTRHAPGVEPARAWLADRAVRGVAMRWREDVRYWHPGQDWIWEPGGMGVFDPGLNGLAILTRILRHPVAPVSAELDIPADCQTPIAARIALADRNGLRVDVDMDWREPGRPVWEIVVDTDDGELRLRDAGNALTIRGEAVPLPAPSPTSEYEAIYARFRGLVADRTSEFDIAPLVIAADVMRIGDRRTVEAFGRTLAA